MTGVHSFTNVERDFILNALASGSQGKGTGDDRQHTTTRQDGRGLYDWRDVHVTWGGNRNGGGNATVQLGKTKVLANVSCEMVKPPAHSGRNEGLITFDIDFSPMASPSFDLHSSALPMPPALFSGGVGSSTDEDAVLFGRLLERALRKSQAIDTESLCISPGVAVWQIKCDMRVLDHDGNILDAACMAALAALMRFRRPDVTVGGGEGGGHLTVHSFEEREGIPLSIYHLPVCVTFAFFHQGAVHVMDPCLIEECVSEGRLSLVLNSQHDLCTLSKAGGIALAPETIQHCLRVAQIKAAEMAKVIKEAAKKASFATNV